MSGDAILMMLIAVVIVWGGLAAAIWRLTRHPEEQDPDAAHQH
ncbi:methionine/alanine import family NSS transporter small subunit [Streptomyces sp. 7-21]|jgi:hypothetical protein|nr:methionine/alanine import family NSS transporter small subunit [Streptomyces sp. 7-21]MBL1067763.1 methionine/alanine import family NSS transporter small subunit [Streptomyces sp. 7-21]